MSLGRDLSNKRKVKTAPTGGAAINPVISKSPRTKKQDSVASPTPSAKKGNMATVDAGAKTPGARLEKAGERIMAAQPKKESEGSFGSAFASARKAGKKEFTWRGNKYNTMTKEEAVAARSKPVKTSVAKADPAAARSKPVKTSVAKADPVATSAAAAAGMTKRNKETARSVGKSGSSPSNPVSALIRREQERFTAPKRAREKEDFNRRSAEAAKAPKSDRQKLLASRMDSNSGMKAYAINAAESLRKSDKDRVAKAKEAVAVAESKPGDRNTKEKIAARSAFINESKKAVDSKFSRDDVVASMTDAPNSRAPKALPANYRKGQK